MRRIAFLGVTVLTLTCLSGAPAWAGPIAATHVTTPTHLSDFALGPPATGFTCGMASVSDPTLGGDAQTGVLFGGPLVADVPGATASMRCTIQVGAANASHNGTNSCSAASGASFQVMVVLPRLCTYDAPDGQPVFLCTEIPAINGIGSWYWDSNPSGSDTWSTSNAASCAEVTSVEILPGQLCAVTLNLYALLNNGPLDGEPAGTYTDGDFVSLVGGAVLIGPDGDMYTAGIWFPDCRPFDNPPTDPNRVIFPDQHICPLWGRDVGPILFRNGDMYIDTDLDGVADPNELFADCPPYE